MADNTSPDVTFWETIDHLGGIWAIIGVVVALTVFYVALIEFMIPRGRISQAEQAKSQRTKLMRAARENVKSQRLVD
ncbi:hypothetical protein DYB28_000866 [Aphanomyces astaci]|uniref:Uncharacterized protein n=1 Tax=Aphanomyces astaci TaxID=112090 RepID=A0A397B0C9_APHAT|nr:hypothetical protein AaE_010602 [Aphanomyces astaci]RHY11798.1 hypothetical protein DYB25_003130 [Aphanomyces astaci]RHY12205.1 hypothetical protein DYB36_003401 [Aphanomyces astaci]RHY51281.1 hypothetical protein DYB38_002756 [Aphanomyces astaci]RHY51463.1 hypothetical protein DYB30_002182 [Aphanomyces astaci]